MFIVPLLHHKSVKTCLLAFALTGSLYVYSVDIEVDSVRTRTLNTLQVEAKQQQTTRTAMPVQVYSQREIKSLNALTVTDIAKFFSGVSVKDYGGIGGLKTVSVRGMGSNFTGVSYDGVMMSDIQSGQIDLGRFSIENVSEVTLSNGQPDDIFNSARVFASASVLSIKTKFLAYNQTKLHEAKITLRTGSFGMLNPSFFMAKNAGEKWAFNFSTDILSANGTYPFLQYYGNKFNLSEVLKRTNSDVKSARTEVNSEYRINSNEKLSLKFNHFISERGLPGVVTFYNTDVSNQRLNDQSLFGQIHYENKTSKKLQHQYFARYNRSYNHFSDKDANYQGGILNDEFLQQEFYMSSVLKIHLFQTLQLAAATDWWYNNLDKQSNINFRNFAYPTRHTGLANIALKHFSEKLMLSANLLYTLTREHVRVGLATPDRNKLSPTVSATFKPYVDTDFRIRAFYKNIYRLPTFNDLYYQEIGNTNLRPENAHQFNVGFTFSDNNIPFLSILELTTDAYYNRITDKIIAIPRDLFYWSMKNKGLVAIKGLDVNLKASSKISRLGEIRILTNYSYQNAKDMTPDTENYGEQIPLTPQHAGSTSLSLAKKWWELGYNFQFTGVRWVGQLTDSRNKMEAYTTHSVYANFNYKSWELKTELLNVFNTQYEVVKFYPMPRRNFRITAAYNF